GRASREEVSRRLGSLKDEAIVAEQPFANSLDDRAVQLGPALGGRPGDMDEMLEVDAGPRCADEAGCQIEVVIVKHYGPHLAAIELVDNCVGKCLIYGLIAV